MTATAKASLSGVIGPLPGATPAPDIEIVGEHGARRIRWWCGELNVDGDADIADRRGLLCISRGAPRFEDGESASEATQSGRASAWLTLFERHGVEAPRKVRGRFAVAIIDRDRCTAFLATDRFASEPWCYALDGPRLRFSDRADRVGGPRRELSHQAIHSYLFHHVIPAPLTIFRDVRRMEGGASIEWSDGRIQAHRWWDIRFNEPRRANFAELQAEFLEIVSNSVAREASEPNVGTFLSGGTDSSTVAGMLCKVSGRPAETYSIGFDAAGYDEMEYARIAAKHFGTHHHEYYVTPEDLLDGIPRVAAHYDQPFGNSSAVPAWLCARMAKSDGIAKLLAGDGGDELFGGNSRYAKQRIFGCYDYLPGLLRGKLLEPVLATPIAGQLPLVRKAASYVQQARVPMPARMHMYNLLVRLGPERVLSEALLRNLVDDEPAASHRAVWDRAEAASELNRTLAFDWKFTLADNDLPKILGTTQLAGLEVGFPLLSDELLDFSVNLPVHYKLRGLQLRWFFKAALRGFLPDEIIAKKKHGFGLPFGVWACRHEGLRTLAAESLDSLSARDIIRADFLSELMHKLLPEHPGYYGELVWILMMLELWISHSERPAC